MTFSTTIDGAAPLGSARPLPALSSPVGRRLRRRGPRSQIANLRRSVPKHRRSLPEAGLGESRPEDSDSVSSCSA